MQMGRFEISNWNINKTSHNTLEFMSKCVTKIFSQKYLVEVCFFSVVHLPNPFLVIDNSFAWKGFIIFLFVQNISCKGFAPFSCMPTESL